MNCSVLVTSALPHQVAFNLSYSSVRPFLIASRSNSVEDQGKTPNKNGQANRLAFVLKPR